MQNQAYAPVSQPPSYHHIKGAKKRKTRLNKLYNCIQYTEVACAIISIGILIVSGTLVNGYDLPVGLTVGLAITLVTAASQFIRGVGALFWRPRSSTNARPSNTFLIWISCTTLLWIIGFILMFAMQATIDVDDDIKHSKRDWRDGGRVQVPGSLAKRVKDISVANGCLAIVEFLLNMLQWMWIYKLFTSYFPPFDVSALRPPPEADHGEDNS